MQKKSSETKDIGGLKCLKLWPKWLQWTWIGRKNLEKRTCCSRRAPFWVGALLILQYAEFYFRLEYSCYQEIFQSKCSNGDFFPFLRFVLLKANILLQKFLQEVFLRNQNASNSRCPMLAAAGKIDTLFSLTKMVKNYTKTP